MCVSVDVYIIQRFDNEFGVEATAAAVSVAVVVVVEVVMIVGGCDPFALSFSSNGASAT